MHGDKLISVIKYHIHVNNNRGGVIGRAKGTTKTLLEVSQKGNIRKLVEFSSTGMIKINFSVIFNQEMHFHRGLLHDFSHKKASAKASPLI